MAIVAAISVGSQQVTLLAATSTGYRFVALANNGSATAYLKFMPDGGPVTSETGIPIPPGASLMLDQDDSPIIAGGIFAVCNSPDSTTIAVQAY